MQMDPEEYENNYRIMNIITPLMSPQFHYPLYQNLSLDSVPEPVITLCTRTCHYPLYQNLSLDSIAKLCIQSNSLKPFVPKIHFC